MAIRTNADMAILAGALRLGSITYDDGTSTSQQMVPDRV